MFDIIHRSAPMFRTIRLGTMTNMRMYMYMSRCACPNAARLVAYPNNF